jgi:hypothetical protein
MGFGVLDSAFGKEVPCAGARSCGFITHKVGGMTGLFSGAWCAKAGMLGYHAAFEHHMAKTGKPLQSGKQGTSVSTQTPYGHAERQLAVPKNPNSPAQQRVRMALGSIASRWRGLTDEQRTAWTAAYKDTQSQPRLGQSGGLTGCQLFIKINCTLAAAGMDQVVEPPDRPKFAANPVDAPTITNNGGDIRLKLRVPRTPTHHIMLMGTAPCSAGTSRPRRFTLLGTLPAPVSGTSDITDLYVAKYGAPPVGTRVFIGTRQTADGWEDLQKDTTAVVPTE